MSRIFKLYENIGGAFKALASKKSFSHESKKEYLYKLDWGSFERILSLPKTIETVDEIRSKTILLVLSVTGAGMETLANVLLGEEIEAVSVGSGMRQQFSYKVLSDSVKREGSKKEAGFRYWYGKNKSLSCFNITVDPNNFDKLQVINTALTLDKLINAAANVKLVLVFPQDALYGKGDNFLSLVKLVTSIFENASLIIPYLVSIITKTSEQKTVTDAKMALAELLKINGETLSASESNFIKALADNVPISVFEKPNKEGRVEKSSTQGIESIISSTPVLSGVKVNLGVHLQITVGNQTQNSSY